MRATFDFESWDWVNPLCCGLYWHDKDAEPEETFTGGRRFTFLHDDAQHSDDRERINSVELGGTLVERVIKNMADQTLKYGIKEWWAHNMGKFDGLLILEAALMNSYKMVGVPAAGRLIRLDIYVPMASREVRVRLLDSYAVVQASLKDALTSFKVKTAKSFTEEDYKHDMRRMPIEKLRAGCFDDCKGLYELLDIVERQVTGFGGTLKSTFSSCAMSVVKSKLAERAMEIPSHEGNQWANELGRKAYYGGRVEVFHHAPPWVSGSEYPLVTYDVNSSYPASMRESLPWQLYGKAHEPGDDLLDSGEWEGIAFARVNVPHGMKIPPLPYRPAEGGIFFPTGEWSAWFPFNELRYARELGCEVKLLEAIVYTKAAPFKDFIDEVYEYKRKSTGAARMFAKLMLNGCYGKFGMKPERDILRIFPTEEEGLGYAMATGAQKLHSWRVLCCQTFRWAPTTHYALASYITAGARIRLHRALLQSKHPAYCDTDSVHCAAYSGQTSDLLGDLKQEGTYYQAAYYAPKLYALTNDEKTYYVSKGFPVNAEAFGRIVKGQEVKTGRMQLARSQLRKGGQALYVEQLKRWNGRSMKRFAFHGGATRPWEVEELVEGKQLKMRSPLYTPTKERQ